MLPFAHPPPPRPKGGKHFMKNSPKNPPKIYFEDGGSKNNPRVKFGVGHTKPQKHELWLVVARPFKSEER